MEATLGRIVHYRLTEIDVMSISRRRTDGIAIAARIPSGAWPVGAQAHIGAPVQVGQYQPAMVVAVFAACVNLQVFLDGNDVLWAQSVDEGTEPGTWAWPPRA